MAPSRSSLSLSLDPLLTRTLLPRIAETDEERQPERKQCQPSKRLRAKNQRVRKNKISGCYIPKCRLVKCKLSTHRHPPWLRDDHSHDHPKHMGPAELDYALDMLPTIADPVLQNREIKELFHQFMSYDIPLLAAYTEPPSLLPNPRRIIHDWQTDRLALGLSDPLFAMCSVALAHMHRLVRREQLCPSHVSSQISGCLLRLLREKVEACYEGEAGKLITALPVLVMLDIVLGNFQAIENHRAALRKLVHHCGLYSAGRTIDPGSIPAFDLLTAIAVEKAPLYVTKPDRTFHHPWRSHTYGIALELPETRLALDLDFEVAEFCEDICRAVEIVEVQQWTFLPSRFTKPYNSSDLQYMFVVRNNIMQYLPHLQAKDFKHSPKSKSILLAALLVNFLVLHINYMPFYAHIVANRLLKDLGSPDLNQDWRGHENVLCWLFCTIAIAPKTWDNRPKALQIFRKWLKPRVSTRFHSEGNSDVLGGICNLPDFVWCSSQLDPLLSDALREMGFLFHVPAVLQRPGVTNVNIWQSMTDGINETNGTNGINGDVC